MPENCRPYQLEIIQLVEVPTPPKNPLLASATQPCSSYYLSSDSEWSSELPDEDDDDDDDDEEEGDDEECESYCSSNSEELEDRESSQSEPQFAKMSWVLAWRSSFDSVYGEDDDVFQNLKTKYGHSALDGADDASSETSYRQRPISISSRAHTCSACDTSFSTIEQLQHHATQKDEACKVAVQYGFES